MGNLALTQHMWSLGIPGGFWSWQHGVGGQLTGSHLMPFYSGNSFRLWSQWEALWGGVCWGLGEPR